MLHSGFRSFKKDGENQTGIQKRDARMGEDLLEDKSAPLQRKWLKETHTFNIDQWFSTTRVRATLLSTMELLPLLGILRKSLRYTSSAHGPPHCPV